MVYSNSEKSQPDQKLDRLDRMLAQLRGSVKRQERPIDTSKKAEKVRLAVFAVIKGKRALIKEYPQRDPKGLEIRNLEIEEQRLFALSTDAIVAEYGKAET